MTQFLLKQPASTADREHTLRAVITVPWNEDSLAVGKRYGIDLYTAFNMTELATPIVSSANPDQLGTCGSRVLESRQKSLTNLTTSFLMAKSVSWYYALIGLGRSVLPITRIPPRLLTSGEMAGSIPATHFRRDDEGNFYFVDRIKDSIRRRGENISSFEIESEATAHPAVREAAAIPVPSEFSEDEVMLVISLAPRET